MRIYESLGNISAISQRHTLLPLKEMEKKSFEVSNSPGKGIPYMKRDGFNGLHRQDYSVYGAGKLERHSRAFVKKGDNFSVVMRKHQSSLSDYQV